MPSSSLDLLHDPTHSDIKPSPIDERTPLLRHPIATHEWKQALVFVAR